MRAFVAQDPARNIFYTSLDQKMLKAGFDEQTRLTFLTQASATIVNDVYPAYRIFIDYFDELLPKSNYLKIHASSTLIRMRAVQLSFVIIRRSLMKRLGVSMPTLRSRRRHQSWSNGFLFSRKRLPRVPITTAQLWTVQGLNPMSFLRLNATS
jgi:hypothetical protein